MDVSVEPLRIVTFEHGDLATRVMIDLSMSSMKRLLEYCVRGAVLGSVEYRFAFDPGEHATEYRARFGTACKFGEPHSELRLPAPLLETVNPASNPELYGALAKQLAGLRVRMATKLTYVERVKIELRAALPRPLEMAQVAQALGMSERSLRRRLSDEHTSYSEVVESAQIELAEQLLSDPRATVKGVAFELGFDTASGFRRAFKRWTGSNPADFRARGST